MEHETAALRDFNDADVACGSIAPDRYDRAARPMSASPPIAVKHWHRNETPLRARRRHSRAYLPATIVAMSKPNALLRSLRKKPRSHQGHPFGFHCLSCVYATAQSVQVWVTSNLPILIPSFVPSSIPRRETPSPSCLSLRGTRAPRVRGRLDLEGLCHQGRRQRRKHRRTTTRFLARETRKEPFFLWFRW